MTCTATSWPCGDDPPPRRFAARLRRAGRARERRHVRRAARHRHGRLPGRASGATGTPGELALQRRGPTASASCAPIAPASRARRRSRSRPAAPSSPAQRRRRRGRRFGLDRRGGRPRPGRCLGRPAGPRLPVLDWHVPVDRGRRAPTAATPWSAWGEHTFEEPEPMRVRVARRAPGAGFGEAQTLVTGANEIESVQAGVAANGDAFVLWTTEGGRLRPVPQRRPRRQRLRGPAVRAGDDRRDDALALGRRTGRRAGRPGDRRVPPAAVDGRRRAPAGWDVRRAALRGHGRRCGRRRRAGRDRRRRARRDRVARDRLGGRAAGQPPRPPARSRPRCNWSKTSRRDRDADPFYVTESFTRVSGFIGMPPAAGPHAHARRAGGLRAAADVPQRDDEDPESANLFTLALGADQRAARHPPAARSTSRRGVRAFLLADGTPATAYIGLVEGSAVSTCTSPPRASYRRPTDPLPTVRLRGPPDPVVRNDRCSSG